MPTKKAPVPSKQLHYLDSDKYTSAHQHGTHGKDMFVCHETVSPDQPGLEDIISIENYLASKDYGIHGMTDKEGNLAWSRGEDKAIFWQCGGVNERSVGIEQVSNIPSLLAAKSITMNQAFHLWLARETQLNATAKLAAAWHALDPKNHPLVYCDGLTPGVTSHWNVSKHFSASEGHSDCHPHHEGGYFPLLYVIDQAKSYAKHFGYHF